MPQYTPTSNSTWEIGVAREGFLLQDVCGELGLVCPLCPEECVHWGGDPIWGEHGRQGSYEIPFVGESCGHRWACVFSSHKGSMFCLTRRLENRQPARAIDPLNLITQVMRRLDGAGFRTLYNHVLAIIVDDVVILSDKIIFPVNPTNRAALTQLQTDEVIHDAFYSELDGRWCLEFVAGSAPPPLHIPQIQGHKRKGLHPAIRWFLIQRADYTCTYCKRRHYSSTVGPDNQPWHLDHADPLARGGIDEPENLVLSCSSCNLRKHTKRPHEFRT